VKTSRRRPDLQLELGPLGTVDPFRLAVIEIPPASGQFFIEDPKRPGSRLDIELAGLNLAGAGQALLALSLRWMGAARPETPPPEPGFGEVRMLLRRRDARLLGALLRRHLRRLPEPPPWMPELLRSLEQIEQFLRWEEGS